MDKDEKFWDKQAVSYAGGQEGQQIESNKDYRTLLKYCLADHIVLDYGCAAGVVSNIFAGNVKEMHGVDISSEMTGLAAAKAAELGLDNTYYSPGTVFTMEYPDESFDVIYSFRVLHVLGDLPGVMTLINKLLKPGGVFISVTTCMGGPLNVLFKPVYAIAKRVLPLPQHLQFVRLKQLQEIIAGGGFEILEHEKMDDGVPTYCVVARKL